MLGLSIFLGALSLKKQLPAFADIGNIFAGDSGSSSGGDVFFIDGDLIKWVILLALLVAGGVFYSVYQKHKAESNGPVDLNTVTQETVVVLKGLGEHFLNRSSANAGQWMTEEEVKAFFQANDPNFSAHEFKAYVGDAYIQLQQAWTELNWTLVRPFESNELFETHCRQLDEYIQKGWYPRLEGQEIKSIQLMKAELDGRYEYLTVKLSASLLDYTLNREGQLVNGNPQQRHHRTYKLLFKRVAGVQTFTQIGNATTNCPNCGGPTQVSSSGQCEYCDSVITTGDYGWVLDEYAAWH